MIKKEVIEQEFGIKDKYEKSLSISFILFQLTFIFVFKYPS